MVERKAYAPCEVTLFFGDGEHLFRLPLKQIAELQEKCGAGIGTIFKRVLQGDYRIEDCTQTIRLGLIGGGMSAVAAHALTERYGESLPKRELWVHAMAILGACVQGYEPTKKKERSKPNGGSRSRPRSATAPPSESSQPKSPQ